MNKQIRRIKGETEYSEEKIEKTATVSFDGDQYLVRIPKQISDYFEIEKRYKLNFIVNIPYVEKEHKKIMVVEIIEK
jgi:predicted ATPase